MMSPIGISVAICGRHKGSICSGRDPSITLVGFGWDGADEAKMRTSFGVGRASFGAFVDLQRVAAGLGYCRYGLSSLAARVMGLALPKPRSVRALPTSTTMPAELPADLGPCTRARWCS